MVRHLLLVVAAVTVVARWAAAEPCFSCGHFGKHKGFGVPGGLSQAGRHASSPSPSRSSSFSNTQSHAHSQAQSHAHSQAQSHAQSQAQSHAHSHAQSHAHSQAQSHAQSQAHSHVQAHVQGRGQGHAQGRPLSNGGINRGPGGRPNVGHPTGCPGCGCGGCSGSCGWCGGNYGRKKRSIDGLMQNVDVQSLFDAISLEDKDQCGLRLVCELAQSDPRNLADDEVQILLPFRGAGESDGTAYGRYDEAAWHGQEGHPCAHHYPLCAFTAQQTMDQYRKEVTASSSED